MGKNLYEELKGASNRWNWYGAPVKKQGGYHDGVYR